MKVLVVDDEAQVRDLFCDSLEDLEEVEVIGERSGFRAMARVNEEHFDLIFMDVMMPGLDGLRTIDEIKLIQPDARIVMISGHASEEMFKEALAKGAKACMPKPFGPTQIRDAVEEAREEDAAT